MPLQYLYKVEIVHQLLSTAHLYIIELRVEMFNKAISEMNLNKVRLGIIISLIIILQLLLLSHHTSEHLILIENQYRTTYIMLA